MNSHQPIAAAAVFRMSSIALVVLCAAGCGGGDAIELTASSRNREPPAIQPIGVTPRAAVRETAAASAAFARAHADRAPALGSAVPVQAGESAGDELREGQVTGPDAALEALPQRVPSTARGEEPADDGGQVAIDEFDAPQPDTAAARR